MSDRILTNTPCRAVDLFIEYMYMIIFNESINRNHSLLVGITKDIPMHAKIESYF